MKNTIQNEIKVIKIYGIDIALMAHSIKPIKEIIHEVPAFVEPVKPMEINLDASSYFDSTPKISYNLKSGNLFPSPSVIL